MNILFIGPPGSGKGTQAQKLISKKKLRRVSTGDLFRKNLKERTALGQRAKSYIDKGELVPDQIVNDMVEELLKGLAKAQGKAQGALFDGFPRNLSQARALDQILERSNSQLDRAIFLSAPDHLIIERLTGRLWAPKSGCVYHITNNPPRRAGFCDQSGEALVKREDDRKEVVLSRLKVFHQHTAPLLEHYKKRGLLKSVSAELSPEEVFLRIEQALG